MISVIVPVYNAEKYLSRCIDSIVNQTYKDIEIILVNDGSTDESLEIIKEYAIKDKRIRFISQQNQGVSSARNVGIDEALGDYIQFIDSDDWIEPTMLETLLDNAIKSNSDISCCQYDHSASTDISEYEVWNATKAQTEFLIHKRINGSLVNKMFKSIVLSDIRFDKSIKYGEDALFLWNTLMKANSLCLTNEILYHVVHHDDSASGGGGYKSIRRDCVKVWASIAKDAEQISELQGVTARAQLANMAFFSLYLMGYYNYKNANDETLFRETLKSNINALEKADFISHGEKLLAKLFITMPKVAMWCVGVKVKLRGHLK